MARPNPRSVGSERWQKHHILAPGRSFRISSIYINSLPRYTRSQVALHRDHTRLHPITALELPLKTASRMRFALAFIALAASLATTSATGLFKRQNLPTCAENCITSADTSGCSATNEQCLCSSSAFVNSVESCAESTCSASDLSSALQAAQELCAAAGVSLTLSGSISASSTGSASGSASSSSATSAGTSASQSGSSASASATSSASGATSNAVNAFVGLAAMGAVVFAL